MNNTKNQTDTLPLIALRGAVALPKQAIQIDIGRPKSLAALSSAMVMQEKLIFACQNDEDNDNPGFDDIHSIGTVVEIHQAMNLPDGTMRVLAVGKERVRIHGIYDLDNGLRAEYEPYPEKSDISQTEFRRGLKKAKLLFENLCKERTGRSMPELKSAMLSINDPDAFCYMFAANILDTWEEKQRILEFDDSLERLNYVVTLLGRELEFSVLDKEIHQKVQAQIDKGNREYFLREQLHVIEEELGEEDDEIAGYEKKLKALPMSKEARERTEKEIKHLRRCAPQSPESVVMENYIECMLELPWGKLSNEKIDIKAAKAVLEKEHYGLENVKKRILEYLAVKSVSEKAKGPILCLAGAPGVGKTSIAHSIARALKREFCQVSLGGVHDEAEIRGHRRTYVAAMPGRVISAIKQCGSMNPVFLFDEIDKMATDMRGDPASAMLEVLDPEQNFAFRDHYLEAPFDLSKVLFITTANSLDAIPKPLKDRMEIIEVSSYTEEEKLQIAKRHLWKKQLEENSVTRDMVKISESGIKTVIEGYTREAGVRELERTLGSLCRKVLVEWLETPEAERKCVSLRSDAIKKYLGAPRFTELETGKAPEIGVVNGLAWTSVGGVVMPIEVQLLNGSGKLELTGSLGDVMKESAQIAWSYVRLYADIDDEFRKNHDLHVHVPEGATPKDGPSAGIAMACAIYSAVSGKPCRSDVAMTGEISLRGKALPIGGVKEKLLAAYRMGIKTILLPKENQKDLEDIPENVREDMDIRTITCAKEAISFITAV